MNREQIVHRTNELLYQLNKNVEVLKLQNAGKPFEELGMVDSLLMVEFIETLEAEFKIILLDEDLDEPRCLNDLYDLIEHLLNR